MAGDSEFKGLSKIFNSVTMRGRANVAMATLGSLALVGVYFSIRGGGKKTVQACVPIPEACPPVPCPVPPPPPKADKC